MLVLITSYVVDPALDYLETTFAPVPYTVHFAGFQPGDAPITSGVIALTEDGSLPDDNKYSIDEIIISGNGWSTLAFTFEGIEGTTESSKIHVIPGWVSLLPVIILLFVAVVCRQVIVALFTGIFFATMFIYGYNPLTAFEQTTSSTMASAVADTDRIKIILFTFWLSGVIALIQRSGGAHGLARLIGGAATNRWKAQWMTYLLGLAIFFDDYASCLIVGSQMKPITDLVYLSHEKLAFLVHATSAPPASIVPLSSWIGFEIGLVAAELVKIAGKREGTALSAVEATKQAFIFFCETIPSRYYPFYMLFFIAISTALKRDFGPMLKAERRAIKYHKLVNDDEVVEGKVEEVEVVKDAPHRAINALVPLGSTVIVIILSLFLTGYYSLKETIDGEIADDIPEEERTRMTIDAIVGAGNSYDALIWGSFFGMMVAAVMYKIQRIMTFNESIITILMGIRGIVEPVIILFLAWTIGNVLGDSELKTSEFLAAAVKDSLNPGALPTLVFIISCITSFCTGTSWGTMSIMFPLAMPIADAMIPGDRHILLATASSILTGSIFGDQCSPISDTSILSALSSGVSVEAHVYTQLPYALVCALLAILIGYLPYGYSAWPHWVGLLLGIVALVGAIFLLGVRTESDDLDRTTRLLRCLPLPERWKPTHEDDHTADVSRQMESADFTVDEKNKNSTVY
ncbi:hypothetical protein HDU85_005786 [Gaertneriomyces sp. JEL0708]|nr:hypothetical protein HDU85_005786 [Gaertneriomyces sp. JEL0708]